MTDTTGQPVAGVLVAEQVSRQTGMTDSTGRFRLAGLRPGLTQLLVRRVGYAPGEFFLLVPPDTTLAVTIQLVPLTIRLDTFTVSGRIAELTGLQSIGFYERRENRLRGAGTASFVTPEDIERRRPMRVTDLLEMLPGVHIRYERNQAVPYGREAGCVMNVWVDGVSANLYSGRAGTPNRFGGTRGFGTSTGINELLSPNQVTAIEVYQSPSEIPPQFDDVKNACGTIIIWTGSRR